MQTDPEKLKAAAPFLLAACKQVALVLDMSNPDHPDFRDSGADCLQALCEQEALIRGAIEKAEGPRTTIHEPDCEECAMVTPDDPYFATPCGTFCGGCMADHVKECGVCAKEFPEAKEEE